MRIPYIKKFKRILQRKRIYRQTKSRWAGEQGYTVTIVSEETDFKAQELDEVV